MASKNQLQKEGASELSRSSVLRGQGGEAGPSFSSGNVQSLVEVQTGVLFHSPKQPVLSRLGVVVYVSPAVEWHINASQSQSKPNTRHQ